MTLPERFRPRRPYVPRIFTVLAAALVVGAIAVGTLAPADTTLLQALHALDADMVPVLQERLVGTFGSWVWQGVAVPLLGRPIWLLPLCLGLICMGVAVSTTLSAPQPSRPRRS